MSSEAGRPLLGRAGGEARLLVVEDEPTILELLSGSLWFAGFDVVTAASGAEALRVTAAARPDLILLDVMMPDADGFEVIRQIRSSGPRIPVIFLTARDAVRDRVAGLTLVGTTTSPSRSASMRCWPGSGRYCAAAPAMVSPPRSVWSWLIWNWTSSYEVWRAGAGER